jgi:hypothetical protein
MDDKNLMAKARVLMEFEEINLKRLTRRWKNLTHLL